MTRVEELKARYDFIYQKVLKAAEKANRNKDEIKIIAVSKTQAADYVADAIAAGIKFYGENYVNEIKDKEEILRNSGIIVPEWHFIGHLQSNKVKYIAGFITMIHSVDSEKLAEEINKRAEQYNRKIDVLIQVNTSGEESKSGIEPEDAPDLAKSLLQMKNIELKGLMTIGTFTDDETIQRREFSLLRNTLENVNKSCRLELKELSMGMTGDYEIAIDEGATMVRIGTAIFGERYYN